MRHIIPTEQAQEALGATLAGLVPASCVIYLEGDLGAGKTTLARGFLRGLGHQGTVKSPTYTLLEPYELDGRNCYHFDLYRLGHPEELEYLGVRDLLENDAVLLVEWPEKGQGELPEADLILHLEYLDEGRAMVAEGRTAAGMELVSRLEKALGH
jgi:tRNA threonylcarbamoyladenosine biosynthesis protein TsaE